MEDPATMQYGWAVKVGQKQPRQETARNRKMWHGHGTD